MARKIKDYKAVSLRMEKEIFERLELFCERSGQSKTIAIERALDMYIDSCDEEMKKINSINSKLFPQKLKER